eukprot:m.447310 g.447310  ORF g.447310 m.447310 type:complete len:190 (-) comp21501_c1_seq8:1170-1739(-)
MDSLSAFLATYACVDPEHPISQPGCFAYADMLMVGVYASPYAPTAGPAATVAEWRSHFGAWCIASSPLILSFDMTNVTTLTAVWEIITNIEAIRVNQAWNGHPGRRAAIINESIHVWTKPIASNEFAVYVVSMERPGSVAVEVTLDLSTVRAGESCNIRRACNFLTHQVQTWYIPVWVCNEQYKCFELP